MSDTDKGETRAYFSLHAGEHAREHDTHTPGVFLALVKTNTVQYN